MVDNVARLKDYKARLILFPRKSGQFKKLDSSAEDVKAAKAGEGLIKKVNASFPIVNPALEAAVTEIKRDSLPEGEKAAYRRLRDARAEARHRGKREKRARVKAEEEQAAKK